MKNIFSERNFAAILFILVLLAFSFAHEDSKKKDPYYQGSKMMMEKKYFDLADRW